MLSTWWWIFIKCEYWENFVRFYNQYYTFKSIYLFSLSFFLSLFLPLSLTRYIYIYIYLEREREREREREKREREISNYGWTRKWQSPAAVINSKLDQLLLCYRYWVFLEIYIANFVYIYICVCVCVCVCVYVCVCVCVCLIFLNSLQFDRIFQRKLICSSE